MEKCVIGDLATYECYDTFSGHKCGVKVYYSVDKDCFYCGCCGNKMRLVARLKDAKEDEGSCE